MDERWLRLLNYWQKHEFRHALTFPFLLGALRAPVGAQRNGVEARRELEDLLSGMCSHRADGYFHLVYRCPDLGQLVVRQVVGSTPHPAAVGISAPNQKIPPSLFAADAVPKESESPFSALVNAIWAEVGSAIEEGHFSCRGKQYGPYNEYELTVIERALA